jgi:YesN/AraC family two-component response regulator
MANREFPLPSNAIPDIIISDIMMPKKDGLEVCRALKSDFRTNHIPIVLLTAKTDMDSRIAGLETGADSYLAKPFNRRELEVELKKLTTLREMLKRKFGRSFAQPLPAGPPKGLNERFLYDVRQCLERHYEEEEFGIKALCSLIGVSRTQLHRKLIALTGLSASYFIRSYRLEKARELLLTTRMTVAEVAYAVGYKDSYYFSRTFSEEFGISPSGARGGFRGARGSSESDE